MESENLKKMSKEDSGADSSLDSLQNETAASEKMLEMILKALEDKKAENIVTIDVQSKTSICDYFVIASGKSSPMVKALCDNVDEKLSKEGIEPKRIDGYNEGRWIAMDYGDIIVHVFHDETRLFYHLERLWQ